MASSRISSKKFEKFTNLKWPASDMIIPICNSDMQNHKKMTCEGILEDHVLFGIQKQHIYS